MLFNLFMLYISDDHDVYHFLTHSLYPPGTTFKPVRTPQQSTVDEEQKLSREYADYQRKLEQEKEEYGDLFITS